MATFTKLKNGEWGLRVRGSAASEQVVEVTKKSGEKSTVKIGKVVWQGNGISLCTIDESGKSNRHGSRIENRHVCAECGRPGQLVQDLEDGMMKHYTCCDIAP